MEKKQWTAQYFCPLATNGWTTGTAIIELGKMGRKIPMNIWTYLDNGKS